MSFKMKADRSSSAVSSAVRSASPGKTALPGCGNLVRRNLSFSGIRLHWVAWAVLLAFPSSLPAAPSGTSTNEQSGVLPTLTTASQAHDLSSAEAARGYPVHLQGVVTYFDPDYGIGFAAVFLCDSSGCVFVRPRTNLNKPLPAGTVIDVHGVSEPGEFGSQVYQPVIQVIGHQPLPPNPPRVTLTRLMTGTEDAQWVEVEGIVHSADEYQRSVTLHVALIDGTISMTMPKEEGANYSKLVDAKVRIRGNAAPTVNSDSQMVGVHLKVPNLSTVMVLEPAPADPFQRPPTAINRLLHWDSYSDSFHRVHLRGNVTLQWPSRSLCIRDATGGICMQTNQDQLYASGDLVDVIGFVGTENNEPMLTGADLRRIGPGEPVAAIQATAAQAFQGNLHSQLVQIDGRLIGEDDATSDVNLMLASGNTVFSVLLPKILLNTSASPWKLGSKLRVTGICSVQLDIRTHLREGITVPKSFRIMLRSPLDVAVLEKPSWWTPGHILVLLALALFGTLCILAWVILLRKRVEEQAIQLRESESRFRHMALHDALTGLATRILLEDRLDTAVEAAKRHQTSLALLMIDIDKFKDINDTFGHLSGDEVLRVAADRLKQSVRRSDTVARLGGDEFIVLLTEISDLLTAETIAAKIIKSLAEPVHFLGFQIPVSASVGVCVLASEDLDAESLLKFADEALYQAKALGRNCYHVFAPEADTAQPAL
jgi:diguanylate cyclase (GGDEF)-like protein